MIRKYKESEIPALLTIWENAAILAHPFLSEDFHNLVKKLMAEKFLPDSDTWVYQESEDIVGFISMQKNEIGGLFVDPKSHGNGIGTSLVNFIQDFHEVLEVEVFFKNKIGRPFYEKNGFNIIKEYLMEETNERVLRMQK